MYCVKCGNKIEESDVFCGKCGQSISPHKVADGAATSRQDESAPPQTNCQPSVQPPAASPKPTTKIPKGKYLLFGACGTAVGAILLAFILFVAGVFASADGGTIEGPGFATPEDAAKAYLNGLRDQDMNAMISAFAVESYVAHYDLEAMVERIRSYQPTLEVRLPNTSEYTRQLNIASRRNQIAGTIANQYMSYNAPDALNEFLPTVLEDPEAVADFMEEFERETEIYVFDDLVITDVLQPEDISDQYLYEANQENLTKQAKAFGAGADEVDNLAITFAANGQTWLFCPQAVRYDGRWYLQSLQGNLANLLGMSVFTGGIAPADMLGL